MVNMKIDHFVVGPVQTNCYFVTNIKTKEMIIIDPGACANQLAKKVAESMDSYMKSLPKDPAPDPYADLPVFSTPTSDVLTKQGV